jgi:hypothetical protein
MVRVPGIGYYYMNDDQRKIHAYQQKLNERKISLGEWTRGSYSRFGFEFPIVKVFLDEKIMNKCGDNIAIESSDEKKILIHQRMSDILLNVDSTNINRNAAGGSDRVLTPEQVSVIDHCIRSLQQSEQAFKSLTGIMLINDEINNFRKSDLYKKHNIHAEMAATDSAIRVRKDALHEIDNPAFTLGTEEELKSKEFRKKLFSASSRYHADILRAFKFNKREAIKHINQNLSKLKMEQSKLQHAVNTYKAIDE